MKKICQLSIILMILLVGTNSHHHITFVIIQTVTYLFARIGKCYFVIVVGYLVEVIK